MSRKDFYSLCVAENKKQVQCKSTEARNKRQHSTPGFRPEGLSSVPREQPTPPTAEGGWAATHAFMLPAQRAPHLPFFLGLVSLLCFVVEMVAGMET